MKKLFISWIFYIVINESTDKVPSRTSIIIVCWDFLERDFIKAGDKLSSADKLIISEWLSNITLIWHADFWRTNKTKLEKSPVYLIVPYPSIRWPYEDRYLLFKEKSP